MNTTSPVGQYAGSGNGADGGTTASCKACKTGYTRNGSSCIAKVDGVCGSSATKTNTKPTSNLCASGTATTVIGA
jgi:hypothetical protein